MKKPYPKGTVVTGRSANVEGLSVSPACKDHIWITTSDPRSVEYPDGTMWFQSAECLVCEKRTVELPATWWMEKATPGRIKTVARELKWEITRLRKVRKVLHKKYEEAKNST